MSLLQETRSPSDVVSALHALGFSDAPRALRLLSSCARTDDERASLEMVSDALLTELGQSADPMRALLAFSNLCDRLKPEEKVMVFARLERDELALERLSQLLSWSQSLADAVTRDAAHLDVVFRGGWTVSRAQLREEAQKSTTLDELRVWRKGQFLRIGLLDLVRPTWRDESTFTLVVRQISDLAQVVIERALELIAPDTSGFCVLLMGKGGARELNYSSDVDLVFLSENLSDGAQIGEKLLRALGETTPNGFLWRADMRLRPDGGAGPLVTPFAYALSYYESYAAAWEWQALIKARVVAGDAKLGRRFRKFTRSITWARRPDDSHLREVWEMKRRSEKTGDGSDVRNVKSGPGGIRDAEWIVQQLQMMLGPTHPRARAKDTLRALRVLEELEALSHEEARELRDGYLWLRVVEHRLQIWNEQAQRQIPTKPEEKATLARRLGCFWRGQAATRWFDEEHGRHTTQVRALCERLFWTFRGDETSEELADLLPPDLRDKTQVARLERLVGGTQTRPLPAPLSRQIRAVLPGALQAIEHAADSERALLGFENLCEASGNRLSLLRALDASPRLSDAIWTILGGSQTLSDTLVRSPQLLDFVANRSLLERPRNREEARAACRDYCLAFRDRGAALRRWRGRELLRIGLRDLVLNAPSPEITQEIALLAGACLDLAVDEIKGRLRPESNSLAFTVIGLGKFGGLEMHYASDLDVMFVFDSFSPSPAQSALAVRFAEELIAFLGGRTEDGVGWNLDARLRPHGASGPLAVTIAALRRYFDKPMQGFATWERQALTRARIGAGDFALGARAMTAIRVAAHPQQWDDDWSDELRHIKERVERERAAKGSASGAVFDVKLGPGGLSDIEWTAQWLALKNGAATGALQTPNTRAQLDAAREGHLLASIEFDAMRTAYDWFRRAELRLQIAREGVPSSLKRDSKDFEIWARAVFPQLPPDEAPVVFEETWRAHSQNVRLIFERIRDML
ncbi:bifunctional glutamine synthetase adenylyltransferase/adenylyl-removing enzyme [Abditibacteriota bacterium]|nr:bifunctional glutamine synthetase adenylyltransferase/adenylyl-removing enzyme [Abditibacteriota bacterium]